MKIINNNNKNAFTLSEILVTLGIVGVIATLTLPNLMSSYTKKQQVAQLQRTVNAVTSAAQNYLLDNQADTLNDTAFSSGGNKEFITKYLRATYTGYDLISAMDNTYKSINNLGDTGSINDITGMGSFTFACGKLNFGSTVCVSNGCYGQNHIHVLVVDINSKGKPNVYGRDLFSMGLNQKGKVVVSNGINNNSNTGGGYGYEYGYEYGFGGGISGCLDNASYCYGQIVRDGWEMNY